MTIEFENEEIEIAAKTEKSLEKGLAKLIELANSKYSEKKSMVLIVVNGYPNSGKSTLNMKFLNAIGGEDEGKAIAKGVMGIGDIPALMDETETDTNWPGLPKKFLITHDILEPKVIDILAKKYGVSVDIFVYIYNPNLTTHPSRPNILRADLIIQNPDSQIK